MKNGSITPAEMIHLHTILNLKNTCAVKSSALQSVVSDQRLSRLLEQDMTMARQQLNDLKGFITGADSAAPSNQNGK